MGKQHDFTMFKSETKGYDYQKIGHIVDALEFLRRESLSTGSEDIQKVITSAFDICFVVYYYLNLGKTDLIESIEKLKS